MGGKARGVDQSLGAAQLASGMVPALAAFLLLRVADNPRWNSDAAIAEQMTDGCNMGVKSLSRYLNQYAAADEASKGIARRLIRAEEQLAVDLRGYR